MRKQTNKTQHTFQTVDNTSRLAEFSNENLVDSYGNKQYNVGIYIRLSREGTRYKNDPSLSIKNQEVLLTKYVEEMPDWVTVKTYIDDGASGAHFNRPGFQDMMADVRQGLINLVLVKDLSRFGRNYLEAGRYLEDELPALGCRFVALSDGIDTGNDENDAPYKYRNVYESKINNEKVNTENDIMPLLNIMNDLYLKNISDRVKAVLAAKARDGQKISGIAPYGYQRDTINNTRLIIDPYAAEVVKRIYQARADGLSYARIASTLNNENILSPRAYYTLRHTHTADDANAFTADGAINIVETADKTDTTKWSRRTVKLLLHNEIYIGETVSFKRKTRSYRDRRVVKNDEQKWLRIQNTHPPIIDLRLWEAVQQVNEKAKAQFTYPRQPCRVEHPSPPFSNSV